MKVIKGQVTIFVSMVMLCVFALIFCLVESARTAGTRWYLQTAVSSAMDSVFSQYHRQLWDSYRLLFAEYEEKKELERMRFEQERAFTREQEKKNLEGTMKKIEADTGAGQ